MSKDKVLYFSHFASSRWFVEDILFFFLKKNETDIFEICHYAYAIFIICHFALIDFE